MIETTDFVYSWQITQGKGFEKTGNLQNLTSRITSKNHDHFRGNKEKRSLFIALRSPLGFCNRLRLK
jgi:hypothetical protein